MRPDTPTRADATVQRLRVEVDGGSSVSALLCVPDVAWACYVFGHGAGAGVEHSFMANLADGLAERGIATLRFQFPSMEQGSKRPGTPKVAHAAVRAAVAEAAQRLPGLPLFADSLSPASHGGSSSIAVTARPY